VEESDSGDKNPGKHGNQETREIIKKGSKSRQKRPEMDRNGQKWTEMDRTGDPVRGTPPALLNYGENPRNPRIHGPKGSKPSKRAKTVKTSCSRIIPSEASGGIGLQKTRIPEEPDSSKPSKPSKQTNHVRIRIWPNPETDRGIQYWGQTRVLSDHQMRR